LDGLDGSDSPQSAATKAGGIAIAKQNRITDAPIKADRTVLTAAVGRVCAILNLPLRLNLANQGGYFWLCATKFGRQLDRFRQSHGFESVWIKEALAKKVPLPCDF
jgi:hypothetical protein